MKRIAIILFWLISLNTAIAQCPTATLKIGNGNCLINENIEIPITLEAINNPLTGNNLISSWGWYIAYDAAILNAGAPGTPAILLNYHAQFPAANYITNIIANNPAPGWNTIAIIYSSAVSGLGTAGMKFFDIQFTYTGTDYTDVIWTSTFDMDDLSAKFVTNMADDEGNEFLLTLIDGYVGQYFAFDVLFHVTDNTGLPLEGALVSVNPFSVLTDSAGMAVLNLQCGYHNYTITKDGYQPEAGSFLVCISPVTIEDTLTPWYEVTFHVTSGGDDLEDVLVAVDDESAVTDTAGIATLFLVDGSYVYTATKEGYYLEQDAFTVSGSPAIVEIEMIPEPLYTATIHVTSDGNPIAGAAVIIGNDTVYTDENGTATFDLINGFYQFTVEKLGFISESGSFTVSNAPMLVEVELDPQEYQALFHVTSVGVNLSGAEVQIQDSIVFTGSNGLALFNLVNGTYAYYVTKENFVAQSGQITVNNSNITIEIEMSLLLYPVTFHFICQGIGVDSVTVTCNDTTIITSGGVEAEFYLYCDSTYEVIATKDGYLDINFLFTVNCSNPQIVNILMVTQNLTFHCTSGGQNIQGVSVTLDGYGTQMSGFDGKAMFTIIPDGTYNFTVHKEGYIDKTGTVTLNNASQTVEMNLKCEVTFEIYISNISSTEPLEGAQVTCGDSVLITPENGTVVFNLENGTYLWSVTHPDYSSCMGEVIVTGASTVTVVTIGVGISDYDSGSFYLYPNPSDGKFLINTGGLNTTTGIISIFNLAGNPVYTSKMQEIKNSLIDISSQPPGSYILKISNDAGTFEKVIIIE